MPNPKRGLPDGYKLDIPEPQKAVQLGDYMDEVAGAARKKVPPLPLPVPDLPKPVVAKTEETPDHSKPKQTQPQKKGAAKKPKTPSRKQINATPQTLQMVAELVVKVQRESPQKDAKASEVFQALVMALHEAKELMNLQDVEPRGRWGTPPAQAFIVNLKGAFQAAIAEHHKPRRR